MQRHSLTDREWMRIRPLLSPMARTGRPKDHRTMIDALLWLGRTGAPWRDLPERFGPCQSVATRFYRWTWSGLWDRLLAELRRAADGRRIDWGVHMVDGTSVRAHRCAAGGRGGQLRQALGRSRGGFGSKLHVRCDRRGRPMAFVLTPGERNELRRHGISAIIPQLKTEKTPRLMDWGLYRERNVVERLVGRLKSTAGLRPATTSWPPAVLPSSNLPRSKCGFENET